MKAFRTPTFLRGFFGGSGRELIGSEAAAKEIIALSKKSTPNVLYLGTATYDLELPREGQTQIFKQFGCEVKNLDLVQKDPDALELEVAIKEADIILVSGGNTLWALDRWHAIGLPRLLFNAMERGTVLAGGSAGAISWFDGGHSDSMDPHTYLATPYLFTGESGNSAGDRPDWGYIRVPGLGFLPGLICPHHDRVQSNGVARAVDIDTMLLRHPGEQGICIDHFAALAIEGDSYRVFALDGENGSVMPDGTLSRDRGGKPGVWLKSASTDGEIGYSLLPDKGCLSEILRACDNIEEDPRLENARLENPQPECARRVSRASAGRIGWCARSRDAACG